MHWSAKKISMAMSNSIWRATETFSRGAFRNRQLSGLMTAVSSRVVSLANRYVDSYVAQPLRNPVHY